MVASAIEFALTVMSPVAPDVPETRLSREPEESVSTLAVMPTPEELIAAASPASVWFDRVLILIVCSVPLAPT